MQNEDSKGWGTPPAPQNGQEPEAAQQPAGPAPPVIVVMPEAIKGEVQEHPRLGALLDLHFGLPGGGECIVRVPPENWPIMRDAVDELYDTLPEIIRQKETQARAAQSGILAASGAGDIAAAAKARDEIDRLGKKKGT